MLKKMALFVLGLLVISGITLSGRAIQAQDTTKEKSMTNTIVVLETNRGSIALKLFDSAAPKTVENFKGQVEKGYYNGTIFHRTIKQFMI